MINGREKKLAAIQSNYIPWKGYFDIINSVDEFVILDDVQYTRRDWRNRNKIKTPNGPMWLTIPVLTKGNYNHLIQDVKVKGHAWRKTHWKSIQVNYAKSPYFHEYKNLFANLYLESEKDYLSEINFEFLITITKLLDINTRISWSKEYPLSNDKNQRLIDLCKQTGSRKYLSGPSAKDYLNEDLFREAGIAV
ncbi:MAG: WbqC family protein, partial [Anaerolineales bacterium]